MVLLASIVVAALSLGAFAAPQYASAAAAAPVVPAGAATSSVAAAAVSPIQANSNPQLFTPGSSTAVGAGGCSSASGCGQVAQVSGASGVSGASLPTVSSGAASSLAPPTVVSGSGTGSSVGGMSVSSSQFLPGSGWGTSTVSACASFQAQSETSVGAGGIPSTTSSSSFNPDCAAAPGAASGAVSGQPAQIVSGSGSTPDLTGLNSCIQQCMAQFPAAASAVAPPSQTVGSGVAPAGSTGGVAGTGATKTVIVAPTKGVLRYVPFAVNASVGDTIRFVWGAGPHTVTQSSLLTPCNKSAAAGAFASGQQNVSFVFNQPVTTTQPTFFFCAVPTHCDKGMFGIINPPNAFGADTTINAQMASLAASNPQIATAQAATTPATSGTSAATWGGSINTSGMPPQVLSNVAENVLFTRSVFAANPGMLESGQGAFNPSGGPIVLPPDIDELSAPSTPPASAATGGASSTAVSSAAVAFAALAASWFAL